MFLMETQKNTLKIIRAGKTWYPWPKQSSNTKQLKQLQIYTQALFCLNTIKKIYYILSRSEVFGTKQF